MEEEELKDLKDIYELPDRVRFYLLDWKDKNMNAFRERYDLLGLHNLTKAQLIDLFKYAVVEDLKIINNNG